MPIRSKDDEILDVGAVEFDRAVHEIVELHRALGDADPYGSGTPLALALSNLVGVQRRTRAVVFPAARQSFRSGALLLQFVGSAVAVVRPAVGNQPRRHGAMSIESLGLEVGLVLAADF